MLDSGPIASSSSLSAPAPTREIPHSAGTGLTEGYGEDDTTSRTLSGGVDFFSSLGTEHKRKDPNETKPDPSKLVIDRRELNTQLLEGRSVDEYETVVEKKVVPGGPGFQWRMMKLKRLHEQAEEQYVLSCIIRA